MTDESSDARDRPPLAVAGLSLPRQQLLSVELARRSAAARPPLRRQPRGPGVNRLPASSGQERLFFLHELDPGATAYLVPVALRLRGELNAAALRSSLDALVRRHEALRTGFEVVAGRGVVQVIHPADALTVELSRGEIDEAEIRPQIERVVRRPFDLSSPPLVSGALWEVAHQGTARPDWLLALRLHHIVVDGWSLGVLVDDLMRIYPALAAGRQPTLAELPVQFADYAAWQREQLAGQAYGDQLEYWRAELAGAGPLDLAAAGPPGGAGSLRGGTVPLRLTADTLARLRALGSQHNATDFMVLLAALAVTLNRWSGQSDLIVGAPEAGRSRPELDRLIGFFVNTLPMRVQMTGSDSFHDVLRRVRATCLAGHRHRDLPFEHMVKATAGHRQRGRARLVQVLLAVRDAPAGRLHLPGIDAELLDLPSAGTDLDLVVSLAPDRSAGMAGWLAYSCDQFAPEAAAQFAGALTQVCQAAVADPDRRVDQLMTARRRESPGSQPAGAGSQPAGAFDPLHEVLSGIWSEALAVDGIGIHDDFFDLGGHSLLATTIVAQIRDLFRCEIALRFFVETPTIAGVAAVLRQQGLRTGTDVDQVAELILRVGQMLGPEVRARLRD